MNDPYAFKLDHSSKRHRPISDWHLCQVRLMNDSRYPWVILIPKVEGISEIHGLLKSNSSCCLESMRLSKALDQLFSPHKLNIAALGNMVQQLHVHHIVRFERRFVSQACLGCGESALRCRSAGRDRERITDSLRAAVTDSKVIQAYSEFYAEQLIAKCNYATKASLSSRTIFRQSALR